MLRPLLFDFWYENSQILHIIEHHGLHPDILSFFFLVGFESKVPYTSMCKIKFEKSSFLREPQGGERWFIFFQNWASSLVYFSCINFWNMLGVLVEWPQQREKIVFYSLWVCAIHDLEPLSCCSKNVNL